MHQEFYNNQNDDYVNRFKQKVAEQKIATIEERKHELARSRNNFLGTFAGIVLAGVVAWFVLAPQYKQSHGDIPTIRRPQTEVKVKPDNPGGMEIPNQDKDVYNIVEKKEVDNTVVENLLPTPEQPKLPDIVPDVVDVDENATNLDEIVDVVENEPENVPDKPVDLLANATDAEEVAEKADKALDEAVEEAKAAEEKALAAAEKAKAEAKAVEEEAKAAAEKAKAEAKAAEEKAKAEAKAAEEKAKAEAKAAEEKAKAAADNAIRTVNNGKWQVQLVASGNRAAVDRTWTDLSGKYSAILGSLPHEVQSADLGAKGQIYRLRAGSFATKEDAQKVCTALKAKGMNDCIVKER